MKAYRFLPNPNRRVPVRWHDRSWALTLESTPMTLGKGQGTRENGEEMKPMKARFPIAIGRTISQPSRDTRHRR
jgi:hypothetical protein